MGIFDSHTHLNAAAFDADRDATWARAQAAGVDAALNIGSGHGIAGHHATMELVQRYDNLWASVGVHPHEAHEYGPDFQAMLDSYIAHPKVVCVGEIGLDYHYDHSPRDVQRAVFERMCEYAIAHGKPVSIHTREAYADTLEILERTRVSRKTGAIIHCFTGDAEQARAYLKLGCWLSIPGVVTYKSAESIRQAIQVIPTEKLLVETDAPYLSPIPYRGKRNEPAYLPHTVAAVAQARGLSVEDVVRITGRNARDVLGLPQSPTARVAYTIRDSVYLNITNRCTLACTFCPKFKDWMVKGHYLELPAEPDIAAVFAELEQEHWRERSEIVFCGYGEPTQRLEMLLAVARRARELKPDVKIRLNTDGLGCRIHGRDIVPELVGAVDRISVSLNATDAATYARYCPNPYGAEAFESVKAFIAACAATGRFESVTASVVGMPKLDIDAARALAESLGARFRLRPLNEVG